MSSNRYLIEMEVAGPLAIFARPDTGGSPTSYPVPTFSAAKGLFEAIAFFADGRAWICPEEVAICRRIGTTGGIRYQGYTNNYGGPSRKSDLFRKGSLSGGSSMQLRATVLVDVCYRLRASIRGAPGSAGGNPRHHLKELFDRRLSRGQCHATPRLGWSEMVCSYWGLFREGSTEVDPTIDLEIPSFLTGMWSRTHSGSYAPAFSQNVAVHAGLLAYPPPDRWMTDLPGSSSC